jgi:DNA-binding response OmpR family regulator
VNRILYVEDNNDTASAVKFILETEGFEVETSQNGEDAMNRIESHFDLILIDFMLPGMSGWDLFGNLLKKRLSCRYAFLSAIPVSGERLAVLKKAGISDYITKPFDKDDLIRRVKKMLGRQVNKF